ncbi:MAG: hypothetical protein JWQ87_4785 [Candidatus Sulfotelmatobacter sp.]|nr:hypothetical protein [Candidatus Sulfotelmatobacter sp.]
MRRAFWIGRAMVLLVAASLPVAAQNNLTYYGGPVVSNAQIVTVSWGPADSTMQSVLPNFFGAITKSPYWNILSEYSTTGRTGTDGQPGSNQTIFQGSFVNFYQITPSTGGTTLSDAQIG